MFNKIAFLFALFICLFSYSTNIFAESYKLQTSSTAPKGCWCSGNTPKPISNTTSKNNSSGGNENDGITVVLSNPIPNGIIPNGWGFRGFTNPQTFFLTRKTYCIDKECKASNSYVETATWVKMPSTPTPTPTPKPKVQVKVEFFANDIGRVTSNPSGINCTKQPCSGKFDANSTVVLTAKKLTGDETGNHFVGWKGACTGTSTTCTIKLTDKPVTTEAVFKIERCFGAVGAGCGFKWDDSFQNKQYVSWSSDTDSDIAVGSILHDWCCLKNPGGSNCNFDNSTPATCDREWKKAVSDKMNGRTWFPKTGFGPYAVNRGDNIASIPSLKAPHGTKLEPRDASYCEAGRFRETNGQATTQGFGTCGYGIQGALNVNISGKSCKNGGCGSLNGNVTGNFRDYSKLVTTYNPYGGASADLFPIFEGTMTIGGYTGFMNGSITHSGRNPKQISLNGTWKIPAFMEPQCKNKFLGYAQGQFTGKQQGRQVELTLTGTWIWATSQCKIIGSLPFTGNARVALP